MELRPGLAALLILFATACSADKISVAPLDEGIASPPTTEQSTPEHSTTEHSTTEHSTTEHSTTEHSIDEPVPSNTEPQTSTTEQNAGNCVADPQLWSFDSAGSTKFSNQAASLEGLITRSPLIVAGQLVQQVPYTIEGTALAIKLLGVVGLQEYDRARLETIWVPGTFSDSGILGDSFVAFLTGDTFQYSNRLAVSAWVVHPEGLWLECDGEVIGINAGPDGSAQAITLDDPMTTDELWSVVGNSGLPRLDPWWATE